MNLDPAHTILEAEARVRALVESCPKAAAAAHAPRGPRERTRAGDVQRLEAAVALLPIEERRQAEEALAVAWSARWTLALAHERIAIAEGRKRGRRMGLDPEDLVQEGMVGLVRAAIRFDPSRGVTFTTYAAWWVRAQITRSIDKEGRLVRLPGGAVEQARQLRTATHYLQQRGEHCTMRRAAELVGVMPGRAALLLSRSSPPMGLDQPLGDDDGRTVEDLLVIETDPHNSVEVEIDGTLAQKLVAQLPARERAIVVRRFGLDGEEPETLKSIADRLGLSRERVRQIETVAMERLRALLGAA